MVNNCRVKLEKVSNNFDDTEKYFKEEQYM